MFILNSTTLFNLALLASIISVSACGGSSASEPIAPESPTVDSTPSVDTPTNENSTTPTTTDGGNGNNNDGDDNAPSPPTQTPEPEPTQTPEPEPEPEPTATPEPTETPVLWLPAGGHLSDPEFQWPAVVGASSYRLIIEDHRNDRISEQLSAQQANCLDTNTACNFKPSVQIHDSILKWRVQSFDATGVFIETSNDIAYNTLRSATAQPFTDLDNPDATPNPGHGYPTIEFDQFVAINNAWGASAANSDDWKQTVAVDRLANGDVQVVIDYDWLDQNVGDEYAVKSYPQVVYGDKLGAHVSGTVEELGVPAIVSELEEFKIDYRYTETGSAERNLAFESFFHTDCDIRGPNFDVDNREYEMMVWIASPTIRTPGTTKAESGVLIDNQLWDVWIKPSQDPSYIAFTAVNEITQGSLNWNRFVDWTVDWSTTNQPVYGVDKLDTSWCMAGIEFGVETWWGAAELTLNELKITRQ